MSSRRAIFYLTAVWCSLPIDAQVTAELALPASALQKILMQTAVTHCDSMGTLRWTSMPDALSELYRRRGDAPLWQADADLLTTSRLTVLQNELRQLGVRHFQIDYGLESDGVVGAQTLAALNITQEQRLRQVRINLERLRWIAARREDYLLLVNIDGARVRLYRGEEIVWVSRVQTERPARHA